LSAVVGRFSHEALGFKPRHSPTIHCCIGYIGVSFVRILHGGTVSTLLYSLGRWSYRHPWRVLVGWLLLLAIAGGGALVFMKGTDNAFSIPGTEAQEGIALLERTFPQASGTSAQVVVVAPEGATVAEGRYREAIDDAVTGFGAVDG